MIWDYYDCIWDYLGVWFVVMELKIFVLHLDEIYKREWCYS